MFRKLFKSRQAVLLGLVTSVIFGTSIILQTKNLELQLTLFNRSRIFVFYSFCFFVFSLIYRRLENKILTKGQGKYLSSELNRMIFLLFITLTIFMRVYNGLTVLIDLQTLVLLIFFRVTQFIINKESLDKSKLRRYKKYVPTFFFWFITVYLFVIIKGGGDYNSLIWESTDARHYKWLSDQFTLILSEKSYFAVGLPILLIPFNLIAGTYNTRELSSLVSMNHYTTWFITLVVWPISLIFLQKSLLKIINVKESLKTHSLLSTVIIVFNILYLYYSPPYSTAFDKNTHPTMILGLIPAVEIINLFFINFAIYSLVFYKKVKFYWIGIISGIALLSKVTNIIPVGLFFFSLFVIKGNKVKTIKASFIFLLVFSLQLIYAQVQFGGGIYPGRQYQSERLVTNSEKWIAYSKDNYGIKLSEVSLVDVRFIPRNINLTLSHYWLLFVLIVSSFLFIFRYEKQYKHIWLFSFGTILAFWLFHTAFIRLGATYRYYHLLTSPFLILILPTFYIFYKRWRH